MPQCILMIVLDCLRADHLSCYGYGRQTTPTIDALAENGCMWEQAHSAAPWTKPSVATMLTGLYPSQHGAFRGMKRGKTGPATKTDILTSSQPTLAESLTAAGWRCGAFINNAQLGEFTKLNRGFNSYAPSAGKADRLIGIFLEWLEAARQKPSFAYLHFLDAHWPYQPRRRHVAMFGGNRDTNPFRDHSAREYAELRHAVSHGERSLSAEEVGHMMDMYDGSIRRLDSKLRIILAMLQELGLRDETAIFITADHGEEFMEHGGIGHGQSLYNELTHVPLIAQIPGGPTGVRHKVPVSQVDLTHTVRSLAQVNAPQPGCNLLDLNATPRPVCSELLIRKRYVQTIRSDRWKLHRRFKFRPANDDLDETKTPRAWLDTCPYGLQQELYDLSTDPHERCNLAEENTSAGVRDDLADRLDRWWKGLAVDADADAPGEVEIDQEVVSRLQNLGYLE